MIFERGHFDKSSVATESVSVLLNEARTFNSKTAYTIKPTVFLSHKHKDLEDSKEAKGIIGILEGHGAKVYIDSMDNTMPSQTSGDTALRIKEIIKYSKKFILLATNRAIESYWCNWELGIGDTYRYIKHIAIISIKEKGTYDFQYKGNEYLQIYPSIEYRDGTTSYRDGLLIPKGYYVRTPMGEDSYNITPLKEWLSR